MELGVLKPLLAGFALMACATYAHASPLAISVEAINGHRVALNGAGVVQTDDGPELRGWARRAPGRPGLILAHLRVELFDADGASLGVTRARWNGALAQRDSSAARFYVPLPRGVTRVRVTVAPGALR